MSRAGQPPKARVAEFPPQAQRGQIVALFKAGRHAELESTISALLERAPDCGFAWKVLGASLRAQGREALPALRRAAELLPDDAEVHNNLGNALKQLGQLEAAVASFRRAVALDPGFAEAFSSLGNALADLGRFDSAAQSCRRALALKPGFALAHSNLGNALSGLGQFGQAQACYRRALALQPGNASFHSNLGVALGRLGQWGAALASFQRALALAPDSARFHSNLGLAWAGLGQWDQALASCRQALALAPDNARFHSNLGYVLTRVGQFEAAVASLARALEVDPLCAEAHDNLGNALMRKGHPEQAATCFRQAVAITPDRFDAHSNLLFALLHSEGCTARELLDEHVRYGAKLAAALGPQEATDWRGQAAGSDPERRLRLGFVSGDLRKHPVSYFMQPVWQALDRERFMLVAYSNDNPCRHDAWSAKMRSLCALWRDVEHLGDAELAAQIMEDRIDILIDLSGHTSKNRLPALARKPAPLQMSWLGYPGTTGLAEVDYFIANRHSAPRGLLDGQFVEKLLTLPAPALFLAPDDSPPVNGLPALRAGSVTFGSFNRTNKLGDACLALWADVLLAVPGSTLLIGNASDAGTVDGLAARFAALGIEPGRLRFHPALPMRDYLALHHEVDIVLDSLPYSGGTTTRFALWMGLPVLTLAGNCLPQRQSVGILKTLGLGAWCAPDTATYVAQAQRAARDLPALAELRAGLRERLLNEPLLRPEGLARGLEHALRHVWRRWCAGLPPEAFEVA